MLAIIGTMIISALFGYMAWITTAKEQFGKKSKKTYIWTVLALGLTVRLIAAASYRGHETDMNCFSGWAEIAFGGGLSQFYLSDGFHDYPPGYLYVLYFLGAMKSLFNLKGELWWVVLKLPAMLADLALGYLAYKQTAKKFSTLAATAVSAFIVYNPVVILNSALWGQVDSVLALFCVLAIYLLAEHRLCASFFAFAAAILIKPQAVFFAPIILFGVIDELFIKNKADWNKTLKTFLYAVCAVAALFVSFMPFGRTPLHGIEVIINQYITTIGQYDYMTVNAFNIYGMFGLNWADLTPLVSVIGYALIVAVVAVSAVVFFKSNGKERYFLSSFIIVFGIYMLSPKMHERYAFTGIFMLIMMIAIAPRNRNLILYGLFSLAQFFNIAWVLFIYEAEPSKYFNSPVVMVASFINLAIFIYAVCMAYKGSTQSAEPEKTPRSSHTAGLKRCSKEQPTAVFGKLRLSEKAVRITAFDIAAMLVITAIYGCVAFYKLGDRYAPETESEISQIPITVDFGAEQEIASIPFYLGARQLEADRNITLSYLDNQGEYVYNTIIEDGSVFTWSITDIEPVKARFVEISTNSAEVVYLRELCFTDADGNVISPVNATDSRLSALFDEQEYLDMQKTYMSGTYFDEIYHPRTAYEFLHGMSVYEWTHPPLGKVLMGIGIMLFGMVPFGWRFVGTLLGVVMVPVVYLFAKRMLKNKWLAVLGCVLFTFDFMHFAQTRLATIDTYVTLFIMLMYYYMYKYYIQSFYDRPLYKTLIPLGISGIFFGLSIASKWTGLYAGVGLAIIFFMTLYERYKEYRFASLVPDGETDGISHKSVIGSFKRNTAITLAFCVVMFVIVPFMIYALSYIPYFRTPSGEGFKTIFTNAKDMLIYHGKTVVDSTHAYSSHWFEWPIMYRPIWYYSNTFDNGLRAGISAFGNPAVWWAGIAAVAYNLALAVIIPLKRRNYYNKNKYAFAVAYGAIFAVLCLVSGLVGMRDERLVRLLPCVLLYSVIIVGAFIITLMFDEKIKETTNRTQLFLLIGYFSSYMPWMLVLRTTYIYHYFPCVVFVVLMIVYSIKNFYDGAENKKRVVIGAAVYGAIAAGLFVLFYPVISGQPISLDFAEKYLKWFESWVLVA